MADGYNPGDILIDTFTVSSDRGTLDLAKAFVSASIYESIFTPGIVGDIVVLDTDDQLGKLEISGDETVEISFMAPGGESANYIFALHALDDVKPTSGQKSKTYTLKVVSEEALYSKTNYVQKSFTTQISEMVQTIFTDYMMSEKNIEVEETKGSQKVVIGHHNPYAAIDLIRRRAVSNENKSSAFVFFETRVGGDQTFKFVTIEKLFQGEIVKEFQQSDAINSSIMNQSDNNILAYEVPKQLSSTERISIGGKTRVSSFDFRTHSYVTKDIDTDETQFKMGGSGSYNSSTFKNKYFNPKIPSQAYIPIDTSQRAVTSIKERTPDIQAFITSLMQNSMKVRVYGDANLKAGDMVTANIPNKIATTGNGETDPLLSGDFLVSRIHHEIGTAGQRPRYTCVMELLKGNLEKGVA
jgi:CxxC motif-containing protein